MFNGEVMDMDLDPVDLDFTGPPTFIAWAALAVGVLSVVVGIVAPGVGLAGYILGCCAVLTGIAYRALLKIRQKHPMFLPNYRVTQVMLFGVLLGFGGLFLGAYHAATRTVS